MKQITRIFLGFSLCLLIGCERNDCITIRIPVDFYIYPNEVSYLDLNYFGGHMYFTGGVNGIVVYRISEYIGFSAFDRACPHDWRDAEAYIVVEDDGITLKCRKCGSLYNILDGGVITGVAKFPLKQYYTKYDGYKLKIHN